MGRQIQRKGRIDWDGVKADYCAGHMTVDQIAQKWRIKSGTLSSRASRQGWPTPTRVQAVVKQLADMAEDLSGASVPGFRRAMEAAVTKGEPLKGGVAGMTPCSREVQSGMNPADYQALVAAFAMAAVSRGVTKVKDPTNWREIATADTIARRAAGLDKEKGMGAAALIRIGSSLGPVDIALGVNAPGEEPYWGEDGDE